MDLLTILLIAWGAVTAVLIIFMIYRGVLTTREDDELIINTAEEHIAREQRELVARIARIRTPIICLGATSGALFLIIAGVFLYNGLKNF